MRIPTGADPLKAVATAILRLADKAGLAAARDRRIRDLLERVRSVEAYGIGLTLDRSEGPEPYTALTELLVEVGTFAVEANVAVLIHIDEVQNITDDEALSQLLICLGDAAAHQITVTAPGGVHIARGLPIAVYLTGLPDFADMAGAKKGATFARRFATTTLAPIDDDDLTAALWPFVTKGWEVPDNHGRTAKIQMTPEAVEAIVAVCCGEPFLFQLAGERAWYAGTGSVITVDEVLDGWAAAKSEATAHVERTLERLPGREREFVEEMARLEPQDRTLTQIARAMGFQEGAQAGPTAARLDTVRGLIDRGKPYSFRHRAVEAYLTTEWPNASPGAPRIFQPLVYEDSDAASPVLEPGDPTAPD